MPSGLLIFNSFAMFSSQTTLRVRYADTDQMGTVYYGNYPMFYEVGRVEAMRTLGISYRTLEESGIMMPVLECYIKYLAPARYDDLLTIITTIPEMPSARIRFEYEILSAEGKPLNQGFTTLVFVDKTTFKPIRTPQIVVEALASYFKTDG